MSTVSKHEGQKKKQFCKECHACGEVVLPSASTCKRKTPLYVYVLVYGRPM